MKITLTINGSEHTVDAPPLLRLLDLLRVDLGLTGTKEGCGEGECGACTVLLDGEPVNACLIPVCQLDQANVQTIEGLARADGTLHPVQARFVADGGVQCGFCTPGMILSAKALLDRQPDPSDEEISVALAGNLCRCTGYTKIIDSVRRAAAQLRAEAQEGRAS